MISKKSSEQKSPAGRIRGIKHRLAHDVIRLLEKNYEMDINRAQKTVESYFSEGFLPSYYFLSTGDEEIAGHIFIITQILSANTDYIMHESRDGKLLTYFINVGRDFPGRLARAIEENLLMNIKSLDSVKAASGIRILTFEKSGRAEIPLTREERASIETIKNDLLKNHARCAGQFLESLPVNYLKEEINTERARPRIKRHLDLYTQAMESDEIIASVENAENGPENFGFGREVRVSVAVKNADNRFILQVLRIFERRAINIHRSYFDTFESSRSRENAAILAIYLKEEHYNEDLLAEIKAIGIERLSDSRLSRVKLEKELEETVRALSSGKIPPEEAGRIVAALRAKAQENGDENTPGELGNYLLNSISDFFAAADFISLADNARIMSGLLRFETLGEFYITSPIGEKKVNLPGYRFAHNSVRGPNKGGLRLDPIVQFDEMCALSFMMTWKTARTRILFGGAKGGLLVDPRAYADNRLDFIDTLANFGRSLFLLTGPTRDVPAGDVGCGPEEIGILFEGFKSALRDLVLLAFGIKKGVTMIGNRVLTIDEAREILQDGFDIDWTDHRVMKELVTSEKYLELVAAPQITGKPRMGIDARTGATGRGLIYGVLAMIGRMYLDGSWEPTEPLDAGDEALLEKAARFNEKHLLGGSPVMVLENEWESLAAKTYPKLLKDKKVIVQGTGKVGGALLKEIAPYGVNIIAVADSGGAILGDHIDIDEVLREVSSSKGKTCLGANTNVKGKLEGAVEGSTVLELECDFLFPCALENVINAGVAVRLKAKVVASGGNGTTTSKAEKILHNRGIAVLYDFLANAGGVVASYFEWLRNLSERFRYEAEFLRQEEFDIDMMDEYIMPEFRDRIRDILRSGESTESTRRWNHILRDIMFTAVHDDYDFSKEHGVSMKTAGFANAILRVLSAHAACMGRDEVNLFWSDLPVKTRELIKPFFEHPEMGLLCKDHEYCLQLPES